MSKADKKSADEIMAELRTLAKFPKGVPADPTQNMSPEDKAKWEEMNEEHGDKFKTAGGISVNRMRSGQRQTFSSGNVHVHVWFDEMKAQDDFGNSRPAWEWEVIVTTSPDPLNMKPRGRELARETFRSVEKKTLGMVAGAANDYIKRALFKYRKMAAKKVVTDWMWVISKDSGGGYIITLGDPKKSSSKIKARFSGKKSEVKNELKLWLRDNKNKVSPNHIIDISGMKLVPAEWDQKFIDSLPEKSRKQLKLAQDLERMRHLAGVFPPKDLPKRLTKGEFKKVEKWVQRTPSYKDSLFTILQGTDWEKRLRGILQRYAEDTYGQGMMHAADWVKKFDRRTIHGLAKDWLEKTGKSFSFSKQSGEEIDAQFEKGVPADPTENMSPEDAAKWEAENEKNRDKFKLEKAARVYQPSREEGQMAYVHLADELRRNKLPLSDGTYRTAKPKEFMLMDSTDRVWRFKHSDSRNYLYVDKRTKKIVIPATGKPFNMGTFDKFGSSEKEAARKATGLYGFTKKTQKDCETSIRKLTRSADKIARRIYAKDERVASFLTAHAERAESLPARILMSAMKDLGPKFASDKTAARAYGVAPSGLDADQERFWDTLWDAATNDGNAYRKMDAKGAVQRAYRDYSNNMNRDMAADYKRLNRDLATELRAYWAAHTHRTARLEELRAQRGVEAGSKYGLYGFKTKTANLGLKACTELREASGHIVSDLHCRRGDCHEKITGFLTAHAKETECPYCKMLSASYPDSEIRLASDQSDDWSLTWD